MTLIRDIARGAMATGYLSLEAENQLRRLLKAHYELEDFNAFMALQSAVMMGQVRQESREQQGAQLVQVS